MIKLRDGFVALAALGLVASVPASAATRAAQALPPVAASVDSTALARSAQPLVDANALSNEDGDGISPGIIVAIIALVLAILLAASGGGGGGPDSPG